MSSKKKSLPVKPTTRATKNGKVVMDDGAIKCLAGFFDVLIQMDLEQKGCKKERKVSED